MTDHPSLDLDRMAADTREKEQRVEDTAQSLQRAQDEHDQAVRERDEHQALVRAINKYLVHTDGDDGDQHPVLQQTGPLHGLTGMEASRRFIAIRRGKTMKFVAAYADMHELGFDGTENAANLAFTSLAREGLIKRVARGVYRLSDDDDGEGEEGNTLSKDDQQGTDESPIAFDQHEEVEQR